VSARSRKPGIGQTIIRNTQGDGSQPSDYEYLTFLIKAPATGRVRITGFELRLLNRAQGVLVDGPPWAEVRVDNCKFVESHERACRVKSLLCGLFHSCVFVDCRKVFGNYAYGHRDLSWQTPLTIGTVSNTVVEDCEIRYTDAFERNLALLASHGLGARATWRHNLIVNEKAGLDALPSLDAHGNQQPVSADNTGGHRGTRSLEWYNNTTRWHNSSGSRCKPTQIRGGTFIAFGNTYTGRDVAPFFELREEDGDNRLNYIDPSTWPGYDMHWAWIWNNTCNGETMRYSYNAPDTKPFTVLGKNIFTRPPQPDDPPVIPGRHCSTPADRVYPYTPLAYPHPWRAPAIPGGLQLDR